MKSAAKLVSATLFALALPLTTNAAPVTVSYSATIGFDPSATVGVGGQNAATLINEVFGPGIGSTGSALLTGVFTYEATTPALNSNISSAGYTNALTGAAAIMGSSKANADIAEITSNAATSLIGYNTNPSPLWCSTSITCALAGLAFTPTGNLVHMVNDTDFTVLGPAGSSNIYFDRDAIFLGIGYTASSSNFSPLLSTPSFGDVTVKGLNLLLISDADRSLNSSVLLPTSDSFVTSSEVETSTINITFSGPGLRNDFTLTGQLTDFTTSPVPEPSTWAMFISGLLLVIGWISRNYRYIFFRI